MSFHRGEDSPHGRRGSDDSDTAPEEGDQASLSGMRPLEGPSAHHSRRSRSRSSHRAPTNRTKPSDEGDPPKDAKPTTGHRRSRFLERWSDSGPRDAPPGSESTQEGPEKERLPYIYQQAEFIRICTDLIRKCSCEPELRKFLSTLDDGVPVDLNGYSDAQMRKKFRHLGKALYLSRAGSKLSRPEECNISLLEALEEKLPYIRQKVEAKGPYVRPAQYAPHADKADRDAPAAGALTAQETAEMLSLREMHEQGFFVDYENVQKEFMARHAIHDVWGKTPQQQLELLRARDASAEDADAAGPWKVFDREKEIVAGSKIDRASYDRLLQSNKDFSESFAKGKHHSSFI